MREPKPIPNSKLKTLQTLDRLNNNTTNEDAGAANSTIQKLQEDLRRLQEDLDQIEKGESVDYYGTRDRQVSRGRNGGILTAADVVDAQGVSAGTSVPIGLRYMRGMPGAGVYGEETDDGYILLGNAPYGKPQRPKSDVFCGIGWGYGFGCAIGPFFGTGAGISLFPPGVMPSTMKCPYKCHFTRYIYIYI
jgi:hypothetical protein